MDTREIADALPGARLVAGGGRTVLSVTYDSRKVGPGTLFVALRGARVDGHRFLAQAVAQGACAVLVEDTTGVSAFDVDVIQVADTRVALAQAAVRFYGNPSERLQIFAVTGTNGKTSTTYLIDSVLRAAGRTTGVIGTLGARVGNEHISIAHTTPESSDLQQLLAQMVSSGVESVAMEASSHAIAQHRMDGVCVDTAVFTNLTQDHLDYHRSMEAYFAVKAELFTSFAERSGKDFASVINVDDEWGRERLLPVARGRICSYGSAPDALYHFSNVRSGTSGASFSLHCPQGSARIELRLGGFFMVYNALAAATACLDRGIPLDTVRSGLEQVQGVPGRFEVIESDQDFAVIVDYAHTPDGLENVLASARQLDVARIIAVFGCGGDRDPAKRPLMGEIANRLADIPIVTSDNPRSESPEAIARDILEGIPADDRSRVIVQLDRRAAIEEACRLARPGDVVVIAGKGHEAYQIFADRTLDFDDRLVVKEVLQKLDVVEQKDALRR
ncbi:MAG: UDP-N-acetylmuramoyl-L-alanyl-D-glutamate--2,6-diaminopimelate ligase [Armatimonadetes bacterium]|nr:UDP-N-acetylmuramoyl-L-alanyl-D-glutamate--2,6-diaminopimelate ligase [Armatimonadota bacterium]